MTPVSNGIMYLSISNTYVFLPVLYPTPSLSVSLTSRTSENPTLTGPVPGPVSYCIPIRISATTQ